MPAFACNGKPASQKRLGSCGRGGMLVTRGSVTSGHHVRLHNLEFWRGRRGQCRGRKIQSPRVPLSLSEPPPNIAISSQFILIVVVVKSIDRERAKKCIAENI